jgi:hypothetical protein
MRHSTSIRRGTATHFILVKLGTPDPYDLTDVDLDEYKGIIPPWNDWRAVERQCHSLAPPDAEGEAPGS